MALKAVVGNCGRFRVSISIIEHNYTNTVEDSFELRVEYSGLYLVVYR